MLYYKTLLFILITLYSACFGKSGVIISGGFNRSDIYGEGAENIDKTYFVPHQSHLGFNANIQYELGIGNVFSTIAGLALQTRGYELQGENVPVSPILELTLHHKLKLFYLQLPLDLKAMIPIREGGVYIAFGPRLSLLLSAEGIRYTRTPFSLLQDKTDDVKDDFNIADFGFGFKVGGEFGFRSVSVLLDISYDFSLTDINDIEIPETIFNSSAEMKNLNLAMNIGLRINLGKKD